MLSKLSKSRKKNKDIKQNLSKPKKSKPKLKQMPKKLPPKSSHYQSVSILVKNHNLSQCSMISQPKKNYLSKKKTKNQESSISLLSQQGQKEHKKISKDKRNSIVGKKSKDKLSPQKIPNKFSKKKDQFYEIVNVQMCKSKTHSEINFSNDSSVRANRMEEKENIKARKNLTIQCSDEYILNQYFSNSRIKNHNRAKVQAAIKIQKVFRGYLTRKMLQQYIQRQQQKLKTYSKYQEELERLEKEKEEEEINYEENIEEFSDVENEQEKEVEVKKISPRRQQEQSDIFKQSSLDIEGVEIAVPKQIQPSEIEEESSIYPQQNESISKYLPQEIDPSLNIKKQEINEEQDEERPYFKNHGQKYISFDELREKINFQRDDDGKDTPKLSSQLSKNQQPIPTDFSDKKISEFHSIEFLRKKDSESDPNSQQKFEKMPQQANTKNIIKKIKKEEKQKWNHVIGMLSHQIKETTNKNADLLYFMQQILDFSKKNKEDLETSFLNVSKNKEIEEFQSQKKSEFQSLSKKKNLSIDIEISPMKMIKKSNDLTELMENESRQRKNEDLPLLIKKTTKDSKNVSNIFQKTEGLKKYLSDNMFNYPIEEMIYIRERALDKKQKVEVDRLNLQLHGSVLTQEDFLLKLQQIQAKFQNQKKLINEIKQQIFKGYKATHKLIQDSFIDARILGFQIPFSRSMDQIKGQNNWINEIIVDEIKSLKSKNSQGNESASKKKALSISLEDSSLFSEKIQNQSSSLMIGEQCSYNECDLENNNLESHQEYIFEDEEESDEEPLGEFKKVQKYSSDLEKKYRGELQFSQNMEKTQKQKTLQNIIILNRKKPKVQERIDTHYKNFPSNISYPKSEVYKIDIDGQSSQQELLFAEDTIDSNVSEIVEHQIIKLIWQLTAELYENNEFRSKFALKKNEKVPQKIKNKERVQFLNCLVKQIPGFQQLKERINQKMTPSNFELLKHMRVCFQEEVEESQSSEEFEEIGKYEMILSERTRMSAIDTYFNLQPLQNSRILSNQQINTVLKDKISPACIKKVLEKQKVLKDNLKQRHDLRNQIKKIELHCIFDAVNETLIKLRLKKVGYSGIGLNQLSFLFASEGVKEIESSEQFEKIKSETKNTIKEIFGDERKLDERLFLENYEQFYSNDSQWIQYSDEALSFALELGFLIQDQIFCELSDELSLIGYKKMD